MTFLNPEDHMDFEREQLEIEIGEDVPENEEGNQDRDNHEGENVGDGNQEENDENEENNAGNDEEEEGEQVENAYDVEEDGEQSGNSQEVEVDEREQILVDQEQRRAEVLRFIDGRLPIEDRLGEDLEADERETNRDKTVIPAPAIAATVSGDGQASSLVSSRSS